MNGQYLDGERVPLIADWTRGTSENIGHYVVYRYKNDLSRGGTLTHELRGYPDHSFADYENQRTVRVLTWRDLAAVTAEPYLGSYPAEEYEIECQDDVDPREPEIRNYVVDGSNAYVLFQLPEGSFYFHNKERFKAHELSAEQRKTQPRLHAALSKKEPINADDINKIRTEWQHKKQAWQEWWDSNQTRNK